MEPLGAGVASAMATASGTLCYFYLGIRYARDAGFLKGVPDRNTLLTTLRLSVPAGIQQLFFAAGMTVFMAIVAKIGTHELAATKVVIDLLLVGILPGLGFGLAAATLVGQALGRGDADDARQWGWDVAKIAVLIVAIVGVPAWAFPEQILGIFLHNPQTLALATPPLQLVGVMLGFDAIGMVLMNALMGAGATRRVMVVATALQWGLFLPAAYLVGPVAGLGITAVFACQVLYRGLQSAIFARIWQGRSWESIKVG
ncbi:MAG: MATE family efflux transporter [Polyangiales bacterium]